MLTNFNTLADSSRLWVYGAETSLTETEQLCISERLTEFLEKWEYHQNKLLASFHIFENRFVVVALDDSQYGVGGCSMDSLQKVIQELEKELFISLLNRLNVFCKIDGYIECITTTNLSNKANSTTLFYDLTILKKSEIPNWLKPISGGWCSSFL